MKLSLCLAFLFLTVSITQVVGQQPDVTAEIGPFGSSRPTPIDLPLPYYPDAARKAGLAGRVSVAVTIDETGAVTSAVDAAGPYPVCMSVTEPSVLEMRAAAVEAVRRAKFAPVLIDGKPATVTGRIAYVFNTDEMPFKGEASPAKVSDAGNIVKLASPIQLEGSERSEIKTDAAAPVDKGSIVDGGLTNLSPRTDPNTTGLPVSKTVSGGVLNGKAIALTKPAYPAAAKAVHASGAVSIRVLLLEDGSIYFAKAVSGHPLLRSASEVAACGSKFPITLLSGQPVKVSGVIVYNFVP